MAVARAIEMVRGLIHDLDRRISQFEVEAFDVDDELISAFCEELVRISANLQTGLDTLDGEMIRTAAHSIKGMGGTMGLPEISVLAQEVELTLRNGEMERCSTLCQALVNWSHEFVAHNEY